MKVLVFFIQKHQEYLLIRTQWKLAAIKLMGLSGPSAITPSLSDYYQLNIDYDDTDKFVYAQISDRWMLGLIAKKVKITKNENCTYFKNTGKGSRTRKTTKTTYFYSSHYKSPNATALKYAKINTAQKESLNWKCNGKSFVFN
ncbi:MAG: hypothetical protein PHE06_02050 [Lachnospiraceae bacterium]|nr:hypothetical protein [Lachnospiraceae bacterium]